MKIRTICQIFVITFSLLFCFIFEASALFQGNPKLLSNYASLNDAVADIGTTEALLVIDTKVILEDKSVTIPSTMTLQFVKGNIIKGTPGGKIEILTFSSQAGLNVIANDNQQIFGSSLTVVGLSLANPRWFGAVGNGVANDYDEIIAALASLTGGGTLYVPAGTYVTLQSEFIDIPYTTHIKGDGVGKTIFHKARFISDQVDNLQFSDFSINDGHYGWELFECNYPTWTNVEFIGDYDDSTPRGIQVYGSSHGKVINSHFEEGQFFLWLKDNATAPTIAGGYPKDYNAAVSSDNVDWLIKNNSFGPNPATAVYPAAVNVAAGTNVVVDGNYFKDLLATGASHGYAFYQGDNTTAEASDLIVSNNIADNIDFAFAATHNASRVTVTSNIAYNTSILFYGFGSGIVAVDPRDYTIRDNYGDGFILQETDIGITFYNMVITRNTIITGGYGIFLNAKTLTDTIRNVVISDNMITNSEDSGIKVSKSYNVNIHDNIVVDPNTDGNAAGAAGNNAHIELLSSVNVKVHDNLLIQTAAGLSHHAINQNSYSISNEFYNNMVLNEDGGQVWSKIYRNIHL
ncbi:right-handed parallel beta-helix repeat-containing protein [Thermodesulfobacteriota bacterium]